MQSVPSLSGVDGAYFVEAEGGNTMKHEPILYISDHATSSDSVLDELEAEGYEVVSADSSSEGAALLYIMHAVAGVLLHCQPEDRTWFQLAQSLRAIRPGVPIILLSRDPIFCLPPWVDACVVTEQPLEEVASAVHILLTGEPSEVHSARC
jgi:DNA-binding NarL/FixJ family response regulator